VTADDQHAGPDPSRIRSMFASIAVRYDRANTILSAGIHHLWRKRVVRGSGAQLGYRILDCATGTGDLAIAFAKSIGNTGEIVGTDFVPEMLEIAERKARGTGIVFQPADVTALPFPEGSFDISTISFGIRNVNDPRRGVAELARVVRSGGRVMILEFGQPPNRLIAALYNFYRSKVLPRIGGAITGERQAYEYLETSAARFPCGEAFVDLMRSSAGFKEVTFEPLTFGIAYLYRGVKR
jgi:demethylmenaquinone methyltransferase/2-methoxy-6-polyprenyl-1,4-benzoquinol methylase